MKAPAASSAVRGRRAAGFTISELMIASVLVSAVGLAFIFGSNFMLRSFASTMAISVSHQEARNGVQQMLHTIHNSVSQTQLVTVSGSGSNRTVVPAAVGVTSAQGLAVQTLVAGPFPIAAPVAAGGDVVSVLINSASGFAPTTQNMIVVPTHGVEKFITSVGAYNNSQYPVTIRDSDGLASLETISAPTFTGTSPTTGIVLAYFTRPSSIWRRRASCVNTMSATFPPAATPRPS